MFSKTVRTPIKSISRKSTGYCDFFSSGGKIKSLEIFQKIHRVSNEPPVDKMLQGSKSYLNN
jgi:hypothetical protein